MFNNEIRESLGETPGPRHTYPHSGVIGVNRCPTSTPYAVGAVVHEFKWSGVTSESEDAVLKAKKSVFKVLHVDSNR
eukprot:2747546-Rhodomonas_salina.1